MPPRPASDALVLIHISDIHFREGGVGDHHDPDQDVRNELSRDLRTVCGSLVTHVDAIIFTGDIAFSGRQSEYEYAAAWIETVREEVACPPDGVRVVPGNHDVDRERVPPGGDVEALHREIREAGDLAAVDAKLASILRDETRGTKLLSPLEAYNDFAKRYGCEITREKPFWDRDYDLNDGSTLRIRGLTTALISGPEDNLPNTRQVYGTAQRDLLRDDGVRFLVAGHHPPVETLDSDEAIRDFCRRACLQLFGHKHDDWISEQDGSLRLVAGALHPARAEKRWEPRYSVIALNVKSYLRKASLEVTVYPRRWSREEKCFIPDCNRKRQDWRRFQLDVPIVASGRAAKLSALLPAVQEEGIAASRSLLDAAIHAMPPEAVASIARDLGLLATGSDTLDIAEVLDLAERSSVLAEVWDRLREREPQALPEVNPFRV